MTSEMIYKQQSAEATALKCKYWGEDAGGELSNFKAKPALPQAQAREDPNTSG